MAEEKPLTKQDLIDVLKDVVPPIVSRLDAIEQELAKKPDRDEVRFMIKQEIEPLKKELSQKPDREEVRRIVGDEVENALSGYRFMKVK